MTSSSELLASGDYSWRHLTAMDDYYQNCPLPAWIGWYVQHLPHKLHAFTVIVTFLAELVLVFMLFLPRRWRIVCFLILTPFQIGIILTANYTFLNYLVLVLGFLLLDDGFLRSVLPERWRKMTDTAEARPSRLPQWVSDVRLGLTALVLAWVFSNGNRSPCVEWVTFAGGVRWMMWRELQRRVGVKRWAG